MPAQVGQCPPRQARDPAGFKRLVQGSEEVVVPHHIAQPGNAQIAVVDDDAPETAALGNMNLADFRRLPGPGSQSFEKYTAAMVERQTTGVYPRRRSHARTGRRRSRT